MNLYVQRPTSRGNTNPDGLLLPVPGFTSWSTGVTSVGGRGAFVADGRPFTVTGGALWEYTSTGVAISRGAVAQDSNPAQMAYNGVVGGLLAVVSGGAVYSLDLASNVLSLTALMAGYTHLGYADGYFIAFNPTTGLVQLSNLNTATFGLSTFFRRSKFPDPAQAMFVDPNGLIWLIGPDTFEVWYDTGSGTQPWAPLSGLFGRWGIVSPFGYAVTNVGNFWVSRSPEGGVGIVQSSGAAPRPVGNAAVNDAMTTYRRNGAVDDAELLAYHDLGQTFINVAFPSAPATWSYGVEMQSWGERGQWNRTTGTYDLWAPRIHMDCFGMHLVGERNTGKLWVMDATVSTDVDGFGIRRLRRTTGLTREHKRVPIDDLELFMDVGYGTATGAGADPQVTMRLSVDGGATFGNERRASIGRIGQYRKRVYWSRLGAPDDCVIEVVWSDPSPVRVIDCWVNNFEGRAAA